MSVQQNHCHICQGNMHPWWRYQKVNRPYQKSDNWRPCGSPSCRSRDPLSGCRSHCSPTYLNIPNDTSSTCHNSKSSQDLEKRSLTTSSNTGRHWTVTWVNYILFSGLNVNLQRRTIWRPLPTKKTPKTNTTPYHSSKQSKESHLALRANPTNPYRHMSPLQNYQNSNKGAAQIHIISRGSATTLRTWRLAGLQLYTSKL